MKEDITSRDQLIDIVKNIPTRCPMNDEIATRIVDQFSIFLWLLGEIDDLESLTSITGAITDDFVQKCGLSQELASEIVFFFSNNWYCYKLLFLLFTMFLFFNNSFISWEYHILCCFVPNYTNKTIIIHWFTSYLYHIHS